MKLSSIDGADLFCGAGGTTTGAIRACNKLGIVPRLLAINHCPKAIATHQANHPNVRHICESIESVNPRVAIPAGHLHVLSASPECIFFSRARGSRPINDQQRATAWHILRWAEALLIDAIIIENVPEFQSWAPLGANGRPIKSRRGETFNAFLNALRSLNYVLDWKILRAANYGDPTTRERLIIIALRGRRNVTWPLISHRPPNETENLFESTAAWRTAREIINWKNKGRSIFTRKRPLSQKTIRRIEAGLRKFSGIPFVIGQHGGAAPRSIDQPLPTVAAAGAIHLLEPFLIHVTHNGGDRCHSLARPCPTITGANRGELALIEPFLTSYYGRSLAHSVDAPLGTVTTKDRFLLVQPELKWENRQYRLDILHRMLDVDELQQAQGFSADYAFLGTKKDKIKQIGNAVPVHLAEALWTTALTN